MEAENLNRRIFYWVLAGRLALLALVLGSTYYYSYKIEPSVFLSQRLSSLLAVAFFLTGVFVYWLRTGKYILYLLWTQMVSDIFLVSCVTYWSGGASSPFTFLYPIAIIVACLLAGRRGGTLAAILSTASYALVSWLSFDGTPGLVKTVYVFFINMAAFNVTAMLGITLVQRLSRTEENLNSATRLLKRMEAIQHHLADSLRSGLIVVDEWGIVTLWNKAAEEILGIPQMSALGRSLKAIWPDGAEALTEVYHEENPESDRIELSYRGIEGQKKILGVSCFNLQDEKYVRIGKGLIFQDITDVKKHAEYLQRIDRLAALGEMAAGLAHEIRNPLASMLGASQFLREGGLVLSEGQKLLEIMIREGNRLNELTETFLQYARPAQGGAKEIFIKEELEAVVDLLRQRRDVSEADILLEVPESLTLRVDPGQFRQVAFNLLLNSMQAFGKEGGRVEITGKEKEGKTILSFMDNGPGISEEICHKIFNPFFTTRADGTGLGLSIVHQLVQTWGGEIHVTSDPGKGTTFTIKVPVRGGGSDFDTN